MCALTPPKGMRDFCRFLGMVQYYYALWARCNKLFAPLTSLVRDFCHTKNTRAKKTKTKTWHQDDDHQNALNDIKTTIAKDVALAYPDYSKEFEIYTDASSKQMDDAITQGNRHISF